MAEERTELRKGNTVVLFNRTIKTSRDADELTLPELTVEFPEVGKETPDYVLVLAAKQVWNAAQQRLRRMKEKEILSFSKPINAEDLTKTFGGRKIKSKLDKAVSASVDLSPEERAALIKLLTEG